MLKILGNYSIFYSFLKCPFYYIFNILTMNDVTNKKMHVYLAMSNPKWINDEYHIIVSSYFRFFSKDPNDNFEKTSTLLNFTLANLYLINVVDKPDVKPSRSVIRRDGGIIILVDVSLDQFFTKGFIKDIILKNDEIRNNAIIHFENLEWKEILLNFRRFNIVISGGSNTKRHILSFVQYRLSLFIHTLEGNSQAGLSESFKIGNTKLSRMGAELTEKMEKTLSLIDKVIRFKAEDKLRLYKVKGLYSKEELKLLESQEEEDYGLTNYQLVQWMIEKHNNSSFTPLETEEVKENNNKEVKELENEEVKEIDNKELKELENEELDLDSNIIEDNSENNSKDITSNYVKSSTNINKTYTKQIREYHTNQILYDTKDLSTSPTSTRTLSTPSYVLTYLDKIEDIIQNNKHNLELAQKEIEVSWLKIIEEKLNDEKYLLDRNKHRLSKVIKEAEKTLDLLYKRKDLKRKFPLLHDDLNKIEMLIITYITVIAYYNKMKQTALATKTGEIIFFEIYKSRIKNDTISKDLSGKIISFLEFKEELKFDSKEAFKLGYYFINIFLMFPHNLFESVMEDEPFNYTAAMKLIINKDYIDDIKENIIIHPSSLPMVCKPKIWSDNEIGGFLSNKEQQVSIITGSHFHDHEVSNKEALYKAVNTLNSNQFSINTLLLEYLENEGSYLLKSSKEGKERDKINLLQQIITLRLANVFKNIPFYLSVHADWRSRIYTQSFFLTYQGGDLASALINFYEGQTLTETGKYYFYIYGANNHNANNISKESFLNRIQWVFNNYKKIINLDPELILSAENKFVFTTFCLNMRELDKNTNYKISTPIFLDATCSGIQHLAALMQDLELGSHVNITPHDDKDKPGDIYSEVVEPINKELNRIGEEELEYYNLSLVKFERKTLKQSIMTKVYNVTHYGIAQQLKSKMDLIKVEEKRETAIEEIKKALIKNLKKKNKYFYLAPGKNGEKVMLTSKDIFKIAKVINDQIFVLFPSLNNIYSYFIDISKLMVKLELPISWFTPNGLNFKQKYMKSKESKLAIRIFGKTNKIVLREKVDKIDKNKQVQAIIPNIIHSLDATHLINVINNSFNNNLYSIITIHDCFGTLPNSMDKLNYLVKKEFILLYSQDNFLDKFHNKMIETLIDNNIQVIFENDKPVKAIFNEEIFNIPSIPKLGKLDLEKIIESRYMIS